MGDVIRVQFEPPEPELLLTGREIAAEIGYEPSGVRRLVAEGMPVERRGQRWLYRLEPVLIWLLASGRIGRKGRDYEAILREHRREHGRGRIDPEQNPDDGPIDPISA